MDSDQPPIQFSLLAHEADELRTAGANCLQAGQAGDAEALFRGGALRYPRDIDLRYRLVSALLAQDKTDEAQLAFADARALHGQAIIAQNAPELSKQALAPEQRLDLARAFYRADQITAAAVLFEQVVGDQPQDLNAMVNLALALMHQGRLDESAATYQTIIRRLGAAPAVHSFLHYLRVFQQTGPQTLFEEGLAWSRLCERPVARRPARRIDLSKPRLRVGYFSPTLNSHQLAHFFLPVIEAHDPARFEIICYSHADPTDGVGQAVQAAAGAFHNVQPLSNEAFCDRVAADGIDILVDLWGHAAGNRLMAFAEKPAPVQVSWLNYINTTGLTAFDAVLHPEGYRTPGAQAWFSEPIRSIGPVIAPFRTLHDCPPAGPTPALSDGVFRLFCAAHPGKLNMDVVRTWSRILRAAANTVLELRYSYFKDPALRRAIVAMFESCGVRAERIVFPPHESGAAFHQALQRADLVLDPFPYQGMTTTLDALAAGVPVLAFEGDYLAVRVAAAALRVCGLEDLVTGSLDDYVAKAVALASDVAATDALRARVRPGFEASPFRDETGFTRRLEALYRDLAAEAAD